MKARIQSTDVSILLAHDMAAYSGRVEQMEARANSIARVKAQLLVCSNDTARITLIKMLKAQVDAGTYIVASRALAQKMQTLSVMRSLLAYEKHDILPTVQEDEQHA